MAEPEAETHSAHIFGHIQARARYTARPEHPVVGDLPVTHVRVSQEADGPGQDRQLLASAQTHDCLKDGKEASVSPRA